MKMKASLSSVLQKIKYGPHFKTAYQGTVKYLKGQHFNEVNELDFPGESYVPDSVAPGKTDRSLLRPGQLILSAKGYRNVAWAYEPAYGKCVASSAFFVLTVDERRISPQYCSLLLNSASCGRALEQMAKGTSIPSLPKKELLALPIILPPLEKQQLLVACHRRQLRRDGILREMIEQYRKLNATQLDQVLRDLNN